MDSVFFSLARVNKGLRFSLRIQPPYYTKFPDLSEICREIRIIFSNSRNDGTRRAEKGRAVLEWRSLERKKGKKKPVGLIARICYVRRYLHKVEDEMQLISFLGRVSDSETAVRD